MADTHNELDIPKEWQIDEYRQWLINRFENYGEVVEGISKEESAAIELDRR